MIEILKLQDLRNPEGAEEDGAFSATSYFLCTNQQ